MRKRMVSPGSPLGQSMIRRARPAPSAAEGTIHLFISGSQVRVLRRAQQKRPLRYREGRFSELAMLNMGRSLAAAPSLPPELGTAAKRVIHPLEAGLMEQHECWLRRSVVL